MVLKRVGPGPSFKKKTYLKHGHCQNFIATATPPLAYCRCHFVAGRCWWHRVVVLERQRPQEVAASDGQRPLEVEVAVLEHPSRQEVRVVDSERPSRQEDRAVDSERPSRQEVEVASGRQRLQEVAALERPRRQ